MVKHGEIGDGSGWFIVLGLCAGHSQRLERLEKVSSDHAKHRGGKRTGSSEM